MIEFCPGGGKKGGGIPIFTLYFYLLGNRVTKFFFFCKSIDINETKKLTELLFLFHWISTWRGQKGGRGIPIFTLFLHFTLIYSKIVQQFFFCKWIDINERKKLIEPFFLFSLNFQKGGRGTHFYTLFLFTRKQYDNFFFLDL